MKTQQNNRVLITDLAHPLLEEGLRQAGYACTYLPNITYEEVLNTIHLYVGIVINSKIFVNQDFLNRAKELRFVARLGSGLEIIDLPYAKEKGVHIHSSPNGNCDAVAEHAMAMLLALMINLRRSDRQVRDFIWERELNRGEELMHKTVAIIGFGHTGPAFAKRLAGFGSRILVYDKYKTNFTQDYPYVEESSMETIFKEADILSFHLPLTTETIHLATKDWFAQFQKQLIVLNTARGKIIPTQELFDLLQSGKIRAAALDVFENEKVNTFSPLEQQQYATLYQMPNVLFTPHIAGWTQESKVRLAQILLDKILKGNYLAQ